MREMFEGLGVTGHILVSACGLSLQGATRDGGGVGRRRWRRSSLIIAKNDLKRHARTLSGDAADG